MSSAIPLQDRVDIDDFYTRQIKLIDAGEADGWAQTFTPEGVFESPTYDLVARGRGELAEFVRLSNARAADRGELFRHWMSSTVVTRVDVDQVAVHAYVMILAVGKAGTRVDRSLTVDDVLVREGGEWLMMSRRVHRDDAGLA
jgi:3-phenylpropionate/cinnamic acid dioxygenase small subunit